jgi:hypothetical protein
MVAMRFEESNADSCDRCFLVKEVVERCREGELLMRSGTSHLIMWYDPDKYPEHDERRRHHRQWSRWADLRWLNQDWRQISRFEMFTLPGEF